MQTVTRILSDFAAAAVLCTLAVAILAPMEANRNTLPPTPETAGTEGGAR